MQHPISSCSQSVSKPKAKDSRKLEDVRLSIFALIQRIKGFCQHTESCLLILSVIPRLNALRTRDIGLSNAFLFFHWKIINNGATLTNFLSLIIYSIIPFYSASPNVWKHLPISSILVIAWWYYLFCLKLSLCTNRKYSKQKKIIEPYYRNCSIAIS